MESFEDGSCSSETEQMLDGRMNGSKDEIHIPHESSITIKRPAQTQQSLVREYDLRWDEPKTTTEKVKRYLISNYLFTGECLKDRLFKFLPFINVLQTYQWKSWILLDILSGLSVGVIHIPQGMGFALLTSVPAVFGLYSSFFPLLFYFFFGTSKHISMGTMALVSLMIGAVVDREIAALGLSSDSDATNGTLFTNQTAAIQANVERVKVDIAVSVSLLVGIFQFIMGFVGLGVVAKFMSMPFVSSFLVGAAVHIITSQVPSVFGLKLPRHSGVFKVPLTYYEIFAHITDTNICALVTSIICLTILIVLKEIINEKFKSKIKIPLPAELFVVVLGTIVSHFGGFNQQYDVKIVGYIPKGIPAPRVPPMTNATNYIGDSILVAIISFAIAITMAKMMASKHKYQIDVNQELYAYGICHTVSSFFNCFAGTQAPPRTLVHDSIGGKTQLGSLVSCVLLLLVLFALAPLFQSLPICVLASVIIAALIPLFKQFSTLRVMNRINTMDLVVWIVTFVSVVVLDLTVGLAIGVGLSIFLVVLHGNLVSGHTLVNISDSELYIPVDRLTSGTTSEILGVKIFRFDASLFFANVEQFRTQLFEKTINCDEMASSKLDKALALDVSSAEKIENAQGKETNELKSNEIRNNNTNSIHTIVVDCAPMSYLDLMGINLLKSLISSYRAVGINLVLANCNDAMMAKLGAAGLLQDNPDNKTQGLTYPSIQDAVAAATGGKLISVKSTNL